MKAVVLLSGGLDSVVNFKCALDEGEVVRAVTCDYGQIAFSGERRASSECAGRYGVPHEVIDLTWYKDIVANPITGKGSLSNGPAGDPGADERSFLKQVWVPDRNAVLLSIGAAYAEALGANLVVAGFNREEAEVFPDNSAEFVKRFNAVLEFSTLGDVAVGSYTIGLDKTETVALGADIGAPLDLVYSCYDRPVRGLMCGVCRSCRRLKAALEANGLLGEHIKRFRQ